MRHMSASTQELLSSASPPHPGAAGVRILPVMPESRAAGLRTKKRSPAPRHFLRFLLSVAIGGAGVPLILLGFDVNRDTQPQIAFLQYTGALIGLFGCGLACFACLRMRGGLSLSSSTLLAPTCVFIGGLLATWIYGEMEPFLVLAILLHCLLNLPGVLIGLAIAYIVSGSKRAGARAYAPRAPLIRRTS